MKIGEPDEPGKQAISTKPIPGSLKSIAGCVMDTKEQNMNLLESLKLLRSDSEFYREKYTEYTQKYLSFI